MVLGDRIRGHAADAGLARIVDAEFLADAVAMVLFTEPFPHEVDAEPIVRLPLGAEAALPEVAVVFVDVEQRIGGEAVALQHVHRRAHRKSVAEGHVHIALQTLRVVVAAVQGDAGVVTVLRAVGEDVDHAAGRVTAVQGALRSAQDFDPLHVEEVRVAEAAADQRDVVLVHADTAVGGGADRLGADAADLEVEPAEVAAGGVDVRDRLQKVGAALDLLGLQAVGREGGHGHRHVLDRFFPPLGRNDQRLNHGRFIVRGRGRCSVRQSRRRTHHDCERSARHP